MDAERRIQTPQGYDFFGSLRFLPFGGLAPACRVGEAEAWRAGRTPAGPVTLRLVVEQGGAIRATGWGPGAAWALERAPALLGLEDDPGAFRPEPPRLRTLARRARGAHLPKNPWVFDTLTSVILQQRVAFRDAVRAHRRLIERLGERAPGPPGLLPLSSRHWLALSGEDLRRADVDGQRARALRAAARAARSVEATFGMNRAEARVALASLPGLGPWSVEMTMGWGLGDPDAVPTGDLHLPSLVAWALVREPYADDARMLALLEPYRGQRFRLIRLLLAAGFSRPGLPGRRRRSAPG